MGLLVGGEWKDEWYDTRATGGRFRRHEQVFRNWVTADGAAGPSGDGGFAAAADRYHLYVGLACPWAHRTLIMRQLKGEIDAFVMGVGTGGTIMGVGRALSKAGSPARIVAVEPDESAVMSGSDRGCHGIQGLADGFIPELVDLDEIDEIVRVTTDDAIEASRAISREEGLLVGISSGANVLAAMQVARELGPGHSIVTMLCDRGERYLSVNGRS